MDAPRPTSELAADVRTGIESPAYHHVVAPALAALDALVARIADLEAALHRADVECGKQHVRAVEAEARVDRERALRDAGEAQADAEIVAKLVAAEAQVAALTEIQCEGCRNAASMPGTECKFHGESGLLAQVAALTERLEIRERQRNIAERQVAALTQAMPANQVEWMLVVKEERDRAEAAEAKLATTRQALTGPLRDALLEAGREIHAHSDHPERIDFAAVLAAIDKAIAVARRALAATVDTEETDG